MLTVKEARETLANLRTVVKGDFELFLKEVEDAIGRCEECKGYGYTVHDTPGFGNSRLRRTKDSRVIYERPCALCNGDGKQEEIRLCIGCGKEALSKAFFNPVRTSGCQARGYPLCDPCIQAWDSRFGVIQPEPEKPPPPSESEQEKIRKAHEQADLDIHDPEKEHPRKKKK